MARNSPPQRTGRPSRRPRRSSAVGIMLAFLIAFTGLASRTEAASAFLYVDQANPTCSNTGAGTTTQPYCTIGAAAAVVTAGQTVVVSSGTYRESVKPARSGTSGAPITFTTAPGAAVTLTGQASGFTVSSRSWIVIQNFTVTGTSGTGIAVSSSANITIDSNTVTLAGQPVSGLVARGIRLTNTTDSTVSRNTIHHNSEAGIAVDGSSTRVLVQSNTSFSNARGYERAAPGIDVRSSGNTISGNTSYSNEDSGLQFYTGASNNLVTDNVAYNNGDHGIDDLNAPGQRIISNSIFNNVTAGINLEGTSSGGTVEDNISVNNGINSPRTRSNIRVDSQSISGAHVDRNLVFLTGGSIMYIWGSTSYSSLAAFKTATGQESGGIQADPKWQAPTTGNLHLTTGSPAIDSADSAVSGEPTTDHDGNGRVDDPSVANTGVGPRAYDDRGAYEFQPSAPVDVPPAVVLKATPSSGAAPLAVTADASASTDTDATPIASYGFDFGDGTIVGPQAGATATHTYAAGTFTLTATVTDTAGNSATSTTTISAVPPDAPPAVVLKATPSSGAAPLAVTADASASTDTDATPIASYGFDFGDGTIVGPQAGATATHTYAAGTFTLTATVTDTAGNSATSTTTISAVPPDAPPAVVLKATPSSGAAPLAVTADASASTDTDATPIASYGFDFGDGTIVGPQAGATATHTYAAGTFTLTATVTDTAGNSATSTTTVTATSGSPNLVGNPGFETNTAGWAPYGTSASLTRVAGGHSGSWSVRLSNIIASNTTVLLNDSPNWVLTTAAGTYTANVWVRADTAGNSFKLQLHEYQGSTLAGSKTTTVTLSTVWQLVTVSYTVVAPGSSTLDFQAYVSSAPPGVAFYADDISITRS